SSPGLGRAVAEHIAVPYSRYSPGLDAVKTGGRRGKTPPADDWPLPSFAFSSPCAPRARLSQCHASQNSNDFAVEITHNCDRNRGLKAPVGGNSQRGRACSHPGSHPLSQQEGHAQAFGAEFAENLSPQVFVRSSEQNGIG